MDGTDGLAWSLLPGLGFIRAKEENERFKAEGERHLASGFCYCYIRNYIYKEIYRAGDEGGRLNACWFLCYMPGSSIIQFTEMNRAEKLLLYM